MAKSDKLALPQEHGQSLTVPGFLPPAEERPEVPRNIFAVKHGEEHKRDYRTIVVCLDGTGDSFDDDNSNIVHLVSCLKKADPGQIVYYQSGIGTYDGGGLTNGFNAALDMAVGSGLGVHVRDAYQFLMQTYQQGDKICLFGFSRGAYTARCLAGMIHKVGLLPAHNTAQVPFAYEYYKDDSEKGWQMSIEFKRTFCMDVNVYFIGVFDSVASVGFIPRKLPLSSTPYNRPFYFRHAMALDERRAKFKACRYKKKGDIYEDSWETVAEVQQDAPRPHSRASAIVNGANGTNGINGQVDVKPKVKNPRALTQKTHETDAYEVWFSGCHCDVGGGAVKNEERHKLSQIPLRWMIRQCFDCNTGIIFKSHRLVEEGLDVQTLYPHYLHPTQPNEDVKSALRERFQKKALPPIRSRSSVLKPVDPNHLEGSYYLDVPVDARSGTADGVWTPESAEDYFDAVQPMRDQLKIKMVWWILEVIPIKVRVQPKDSDTWVKKVSLNLGRHRAVQEHRPYLHWTVRERERAKGYEIKTRVDRQATWKVVA